MKLFSRGGKKLQEEEEEEAREKHEREQDERIERIEAEVSALSLYVGRQPNLKAVNGG